MGDNGHLTPFQPGVTNIQSRGTVDLERADSFAYLRANWDVLLRHRWLILTAALLLTALVTLYSFKAVPVYRATTVIEVDAEVPYIQALNDLFRSTTGDDSTFLTTQISVLGSSALASGSLQAGVTAMRKQTNLSGKPIGLRPRFLIVPPDLEFQRVVRGEVIRVEHVQTVAELRIRNEHERLPRGKLGHRLAILNARSQRRRQRPHGVQVQVRGVQAPHHLGAAFARVEP